MRDEIISIFETEARIWGAKYLSELLGISRATLLNYRKGQQDKVPHELFVRLLELSKEAQRRGISNMYYIRRNVKKRLGRPRKG